MVAHMPGYQKQAMSPSRISVASIFSRSSAGSGMRSEGTVCTESSAMASVSEPSSTAIRTWAHGLFKSVGQGPVGADIDCTPNTSFAEEESLMDGCISPTAALKAAARRQQRRRCCAALLGLIPAILAVCALLSRAEGILLAVAPTWGVSTTGSERIGRLRGEGHRGLVPFSGQAPRLPEEAQFLSHSPSTVAASCTYADTSMCPARSLFDSPEVHAVATKELMRAGRRFFTAADRPMIWAIVADGFRNISAMLAERAPEVASSLDKVKLSEAQKDAVLMSMGLPSEPKLQRLGLEIAWAIRDSGCSLEACVQQHIEERLLPRRAELQSLRELLVPTPLRKLWGQTHQWAMTLDPENIRAMESVVGKFVGEVDLLGESRHLVGPGEAVGLSLAEKRLVVIGGVVEEGRALLDSLRLSARFLHGELDAPLWATSLSGVWRDFGASLTSCSADGGEVSRIHFLKELFCPLKLGSQGMEALRALSATAAVPRSPVAFSGGPGEEEPMWAPV